MAVNQAAVNEAADAIKTTGSVADAMNTLTTKDANVFVSMSTGCIIPVGFQLRPCINPSENLRHRRRCC